MATAAVPNVDAVLQVCGIMDTNHQNTIIQTESFNALQSFAILETDGNVTEMAKRMASCTAAVTIQDQVDPMKD